MGLLNKIIFRFDDDFLPDEAVSEWVLHQQSPPPESGDPEVMAFVVKPLGSKAHRGILRRHAGPPFRTARRQSRRRLRQGGAHRDVWSRPGRPYPGRPDQGTHWGQNPWTPRAYSAALPGASKMHAELAKPVDDLVFFAGEAAGSGGIQRQSRRRLCLRRAAASRAVQASLAERRPPARAADRPESRRELRPRPPLKAHGASWRRRSSAACARRRQWKECDPSRATGGTGGDLFAFPLNNSQLTPRRPPLHSMLPLHSSPMSLMWLYDFRAGFCTWWWERCRLRTDRADRDPARFCPAGLATSIQ